MGRTATRERAVRVVVYPRESNPYQSMLYAALQEQADGVRFDVVSIPAPRGTARVLRHPLTASWTLLTSAVTSRRRILHIHWMYAFRLPGKSSISRRLSYATSVIFLCWAKALRYRIVWTVHNVMPHRPITSNDVGIRRKLARAADAVIVHSNSTIPALAAVGVTVRNPTVIPHPSYQGRYPDAGDRATSRRALGIEPDSVVCLFFGRIEPYKNVPALIDAFGRLVADNPDAHLLIAGACNDAALRSTLDHQVQSAKHVTAVLRRIDDADVATYFRAADVAACPFLDITTSGSAMLALTMSVPIVAPRVGALADLPDDVGFFYDPDADSALEHALSHALSSPDRVAAAAARAGEFAAGMTWQNAAHDTAAVYRSLMR